MKLKVQHVMDATIALTNIINRQCSMPQRGKYLLARMHTKLKVEFDVMDARRDEMIKAYNNPKTTTLVGEAGATIITQIEGQWQVPDEKMSEYVAAWKEIGDQIIDVDVQPIPLLALCMPDGTDGLIEAAEFITLGELVVDTSN